LWSYSSDLPFLSVAMGDIDGDKDAEIIAGSFLGQVFVFDGKGKLLWKREFGQKNLVSAVACGDLDGRKGDEILVGTSLKGVFALDGTGRKLWHLKPKDIFVNTGRTNRQGGRRKKRVSHNKLENVQTIQVVDLDSDGKNEIVVGARPHGMVVVLDADGRRRWQRSMDRYMDITTAVWAAVGDFLPKQRGLEVFAIAKGTGIAGHRGEGAAVLLDSCGSGHYLALPKTQFFSAVPINISKGIGSDDVILSSAARGRGMSRVTFSDGGIDQLEGYCDDIELKILNGLPRVKKGAKAASKNRIDRIFHFLFRVDYRDIYRKNRKFVESFLRPVWNIPGNNAIVITGLK
ncbi:MAG: hypothetical protein JRI36_13030, partial [Deltaproteobacteria bacterium]|nr:hypothetical protein [Deltaproteobacteria bacterium]